MNVDIKLGLLFLVTENDVRQPGIWRRFIQSAKGDVRVYCHPKQTLSPNSVLAGSEILEKHQTEWGKIGIVFAMFALLKAAMEDPKLTHFQFVSESCIPVKPWHEIQAQLTKDPQSRIMWSSWEEMSHDHQVRISRTPIAKSFWLHHPQWLNLNRETAFFLLEHMATLEKFRGAPCSDEHAIGTLLAIHGYDMTRINRTPTTWVLWRTPSYHPETIHEVTPILIEQWNKFDGFFARKLSPNCEVTEFGADFSII